MSNDTLLDRLRTRADEALSKLEGLSDRDVESARGLVEELRNAREYGRMGRLAEAVSRRDPKDPKNRRLYAQYLIDTGKATAAVNVLQPLARRLSKSHSEFAEASGLLGRAYKGRRRAHHQGIRRGGGRQSVPDREHAPSVHRGMGSRSNGRSRSRARRHAPRAASRASRWRTRDGSRPAAAAAGAAAS
jgi:predicted Zn-dependent protease